MYCGHWHTHHTQRHTHTHSEVPRDLIFLSVNNVLSPISWLEWRRAEPQQAGSLFTPASPSEVSLQSEVLRKTSFSIYT